VAGARARDHSTGDSLIASSTVTHRKKLTPQEHLTHTK
jgi:hypothetical protein